MTDVASRLARIETLVETLHCDQKELQAWLTRVLDAQEQRIRIVELDRAGARPRLETLSDEVATLRKRVNTWGSLNTVLAALAGIFGWQK